jgi:hypothetical protein
MYQKRRPQLGQRADCAFVIEDDVEVETILDHHIKMGFKQIIVSPNHFPVLMTIL